ECKLMAQEQFSNLAQTTIADGGGITPATTIFNVADSSLFPAQPQFRIRIGNELMLVTEMAGVQFTVIRGIEATTSASHAFGATVTHVLTAGGLSQFGADLTGLTGPQGIPGLQGPTGAIGP